MWKVKYLKPGETLFSGKCSEVRLTQFVEEMNCMSHCIVQVDDSIGEAKLLKQGQTGQNLGRKHKNISGPRSDQWPRWRRVKVKKQTYKTERAIKTPDRDQTEKYIPQHSCEYSFCWEVMILFIFCCLGTWKKCFFHISPGCHSCQCVEVQMLNCSCKICLPWVSPWWNTVTVHSSLLPHLWGFSLWWRLAQIPVEFECTYCKSPWMNLPNVCNAMWRCQVCLKAFTTCNK